jgi:hypothetical protein
MTSSAGPSARAAALVNRSPRAPGTGILTPLGEQLCQQARDYLQPPAAGLDAPLTTSRARSRAGPLPGM